MWGIFVTTSTDNSILNNRVNDTYGGIRIGANDNSITNNLVTGSTDGIELIGAEFTTVSDNNATGNDQIGIYLEYSSNNTISGNNVSYNYVGIFVNSSSNNNNVTENIATFNNDDGINIRYSSHHNTLSKNNASNNVDRGMSIRYSSVNNVIEDNNVNSNHVGIGIGDSSNSNTITGNNASSNKQYGIYLFSSSNNNLITNNLALGNPIWNFYSLSNSINNTVVNLTINPTISFTSKDVAIKSVSPAPPDDSGYQNISHYVNATNNSADSWLYLNVSYSDLDVTSVDENSLRMRRYSSGVWTTVPPPNGVNTAQNYVFSNITAFSVFAPMAPTAVPTLSIQSPQNITYLYSSVPLTFTANDTNGIDWTGYSLDGQNTVTSGNTTLTSLSEGAHNLTAQANNTLSNMAAETEWFSVDKCIEDANPGDTCTFQPGNYSNTTITTENLTITCQVTGECKIIGKGKGVGVKIIGNKTTFSNFTVSNWTKGILACGTNITVTKNTLTENRVGIEACNTDNINVIDNQITSNHSIGISLIDTRDTTITNNNVSNLTAGIYLKNSTRNLITENTANQCTYGYALQDSSVNTLRQNEGQLGEKYDYILTTYSQFNTLDSNTYCTVKTNPQNTFKNNIKGGICP
jgi:parallel beta-helix repeat protein